MDTTNFYLATDAPERLIEKQGPAGMQANHLGRGELALINRHDQTGFWRLWHAIRTVLKRLLLLRAEAGSRMRPHDLRPPLGAPDAENALAV